MVRDSVLSISLFVLRLSHCTLKESKWRSGTLVLKVLKALVTKGKDLGDKKNDLNDQRKDLDESKAAMPQALESKTNVGSAKPNQLPVQVLEKNRRLCH